MLNNYDIICIAPHPWSDTWKRRHHIMSRMATTNRVLFVEPPLSALTPLRDRCALKVLRDSLLGLREVQKRLYVCPTWNMLPFARAAWIARLDKEFVLRRVTAAASELGFANPILWQCYNPLLWDFGGNLGESLRCYDCYDDYASFGNLAPEIQRRIVSWEEEVTRRADIVFAVSERLAERLRAYNPRVFVAGNGVDSVLFKKAQAPTTRIPEELTHIAKPILAYIGSISHKVDFDLLRLVATTQPDWSIVLIGPVHVALNSDRALISRLEELPNVHFLGHRLRETLPAYLKGVDVCLMPLKHVELNYYASHPNKLFEYLAAGKPVVALDVEGALKEHGRFISIAADTTAFMDAIREAIQNGAGETAVAGRMAYAESNDWQHRVDRMRGLIATRLHEKQTGVPKHL